jgi:replicative DNA helicase
MASLKVPPHSEEAERSVLGAVLIDKNSMSLISDKLKPQDFYDSRNGKIFEAMMGLHDEAKPIDILTLSKALKKNKTEVKT